MNIKLPAPHEQLAGCVWLPRILAKARLLLRNELPPEYAERFCHTTGVDHQLLTHLGLTREQILSLAAAPENETASQFHQLMSDHPERVEKWNQIAVNLGRPGYPLAERLPIALTTTYKHLASDGRKFATVFEVITADETIVSV